MRREKWNFRPRSQKPECGPGGRASGWEAGEERREETEQPKQRLGHGRGVGSGCEIGVNWAIRGPCSRVTEPARRRQCQPWSWERCACAGSSPPSPLPPAFSALCHLPDVRRLKVLLTQQVARAWEVAFGGAPIGGENTDALPKLVFRQ